MAGKNFFGGRCAIAAQKANVIDRQRKTVLLAALAGLVAAPAAVQGTGYAWNINASGLFETASNWSPAGPPALAGDTTTFAQTGTYTVTFSNNRTNASSLVDNGNVTWALSGQTYTLNGITGLGVGFNDGTTGRLTLLNGTVAASVVDIASAAADTGFLTISSNATMTATGLFRVGVGGQGNLTVNGGGLLTTSNINSIGTNASAIGTATISGANSTWNASNTMLIGDSGTGSLTISSGGLLNSTAPGGIVLGNSGGSAGTLTVNGIGSQLIASATITIGNTTTGTATISGGGTVSIGGGAVVGGNSATSKGTLTVSGVGSVFSSSGSMTVGSAGTGEVDVLAGGSLSASQYIIGTVGGSHGTAIVSGNGSSFFSFSGLTLGNSGAGTLDIESGANASVGTGTIIIGSTATGSGLLQVSGAGTTFSAASSAITIGSAGTGTLNVTNGGVMTVGNTSLGATNSAVTSAMTVSGAGATFNASLMNIGATNSGFASLLVEKGGTVNLSGPLTINDPTGVPTGTLTINSGGTVNLANGLTRLGNLNLNGGNLNLNGGVFNNGAAPTPLNVNGLTASDLPVLHLSGNTTTTNVSSLNVGFLANTGAVEVVGGAHLTISGAASLGLTGGSGSVLVDGVGSNWTSSSTLQFGVSGTGVGAMTISNGGTVNSAGGVLGQASGTAGTVSATGTGSSWISSTTVTLGGGGNGTLTIADGASVSAAMNVGSSSPGTLSVRSGGSFASSQLFVGIGGTGTMTVESGGTVNTTGTTFIANGTATGTATVTGSGSSWTAAAIQVGAASSGSGALNVLAGGSVTTNTFTLNDPTGSATGTLLIDGGNVTVNGTFTRRGTLDFRDGTLTINGGTFDNAASASPLVINSSAAGKLATLRVTGGSGAQLLRVSDLTIGQNHGGAFFVEAGTTLGVTGNVAIAEQASGNGSMTVDGIFQNAGAFRVGAGFATTGGPGTLLVQHNGEVVVGTTLFIYPQGTVRLDNGRLMLNNFTPQGGTFDFISGSVTFLSSHTLSSTDLGGLLGASHTLRDNQVLFGNADLTVGSNLKVDGGTLEAANDLIVSANSFLTLVRGNAQCQNNFTNQAGGVVSLEGGTLAAEFDINNSGEIQLHGGSSLVVSPSGSFENSGLLTGNGRISPPLFNHASGVIRASGSDRLTMGDIVDNSGLISLLSGGTVEFRGALNNEAGARITGRGTVDAPAGVENNGQIAFSGELSDFFGPIANNLGGKIIVTGNGLATFYDTITHNAGAEIRVSAGSTAVFLGAVNGVGTFSGSGTKYFEGGGSAVGPVITPGSTVVEAAASLSATLIREDSLTVNGLVTINTSGGTSHLNHLAISGSTDNWDGTLDLKNNSLVLEGGNLAVITNQIKSGLYEGTGITSSAPGNPFRLGSMSNAGTIYSTFQGIGGLDGDEVLIRYTRIGDLNLDGTVTISDFIDLASNFNHIGGSTWQMGDVNYDGSVTISDFIDLASNFNQSVSGDALPISEEDAAMLASFAAEHGASAVPEPHSLVVVSLGLLSIRRRRRF